MKKEVALEMLWDTRSCARDCGNCIQDNKCILKKAYKTLKDAIGDKENERIIRKIK